MFKRNIDYILTDMMQMEIYLSRRDVKYRRNYNRYYNNAGAYGRMEDINTLYGNILAYYSQIDEESGAIPYFNILRSAVDTTVSKLSQTKVRPFFNPVLGNYKTVKTCRNAQIYFDEFFDKEKVYAKLINAITNALIFDMGVLWIDDEDKTVKKVNPWEFVFDAGEMSRNDITRVELNFKQYPLISLRNILKENSAYYGSMVTTPNAFVNYRIYWDLLGKKQYKFIGTDLIQERSIEYTVPPFVWMYYKDPIKGAFSDSMIDVIYRLQKEIDDITFKIGTAVNVSPTNTIFVPRNSDLKTSMIASSRIGDVFEYNLPSTGTNNPVFVSTPPAIDSQYIQLLELFEQKAYNMVGISQLSAQSKKPTGLNSGVALQTLEDVESERHNVILNNYINLARDLAERIIDIYPANEDVLPKRRARSAITWKDIKKERDMFNIQYSASNSLSKDPKVKMEQIEKLIQMQIIDPSTVASLLEMPDLEGAYGIATAAYDANEKTIERVIENGPDKDGRFYFYEATNIQQLFSQSLNTLLRLDANDEDPEVMNNLTLFINQLKGQMDEINGALMAPPPQAPMAPEAPMGPEAQPVPMPPEGLPPQVQPTM